MLVVRAVVPALVALSTLARSGLAQEEGDMLIGSTARGGGALAIRFDFSTPVRLVFSGTVGRVATYTGTDPGFDALVGDRPIAGLFALRAGTDVRLQLLENDPTHTAVKVGDSLLTRAGDTATLGRMGVRRAGTLHTHPEFQLLLREEESAYGEAEIVVRLVAGDDTYAPSPPYRLFLTNGFLRPITPTETYSAAALRCRRALARGVWEFAGDELASVRDGVTAAAGPDRVLERLQRDCEAGTAALYDARELRALLALVRDRVARLPTAARATCQPVVRRALTAVLRGFGSALGPCLLRVEAARAREAARLPVASGLVASACGATEGPAVSDSATPLGRVIARRARVRARLARACGDDTQATALLRAAHCTAAEILSAVHPGAKDDLGAFTARRSQGGRPLAEYFPCLRGGAAHVHDHAHHHH